MGLPPTLPAVRSPGRIPAVDPVPGDDAETRRRMRRAIYDVIDANDGRRIGYPRADSDRIDEAFLRLRTPVDLDDVMLTEQFVEHLVDDHEIPAHRERFAQFAVPTIRDPAEVWLQAVEKDGAIVYRRLFLSAFEGDRAMVAVVQEDLYGQLSWTAFPIRNRGDVNSRQRGHLLHRRREDGGRR